MDKAVGARAPCSWKPAVLELFTDLYRKYDCLYNCSHRDYKNKAIRRAALENISLALGKSVADIQRKIVGLRTQFAREKRKQQTQRGRCKTSLDDTDTELYTSKWFLMPRLAFLDPYVNHRTARLCSVRTTTRQLKTERLDIDEETDDFDEGTVDCTSVDMDAPSSDLPDDQTQSDKPTAADETASGSSILPDLQTSFVTSNTGGHPKRQRTGDREQTCSCSCARDDQCGLFGRFVARELQAIDDDAVRTVTKKQIMNLIFDAQL